MARSNGRRKQITMLDILLDDYLAKLANERDFDAPFLALLSALGFYDVHYTHGTGEFGKDFIAKKKINRRVVQHSFQLKRHVTQGEAREVASQLLEAVQMPGTHPNFDTGKPHQPVLVVTDRLAPNASLSLANFNIHASKFNALPLEVWARERLSSDLAQVGLAGVHRATESGLQSYGQFYSLVGQAIEGRLTAREIERYSRSWLDVPIEIPDTMVQGTLIYGEKSTVESSQKAKNAAASKSVGREMLIDRRLLIAAVEATLLAARCRESRCFYEETVCLIALWRAVLHAWTRAKEADADETTAFYSDLNARTRRLVTEAVDRYGSEVENLRAQSKGNLARCMGTRTGTVGAHILTYSVECARWVEMMGLRYFLLDQANKAGARRARSQLVARLADFVSNEPGCVHPISERFAVSVVWPVVALALGGETKLAAEMVRKTAIWLGNRHEFGKGLARIEASADDEARVLLGSSFEFFDFGRSPSSLLASALADLAAWLGEAALYESIVNDWMALDICPTFYAPRDSEGVFRFDASDIGQYPNMAYSRAYSPFGDLTFAPHIAHEPQNYSLLDSVGLGAFAATSLLLRDRYFPGLWPQKS